jgi:diguanylate cyclase (GGDEF)-like protein
MSEPNSIRVLILCRSTDDTRRFRSWLTDEAEAGTQGEVFLLWDDAAEIPTYETIEVVVSDLDSKALAAKLADADASVQQLHPTWVGVVGIGQVDPAADAHLPFDCTRRELRMACKLTAEIARLRKQRDELARAQVEVMQLAETDPLTGLANRRAWDARLSAMLARTARGGESLWLALVDLDAFKAINDRDGMTRGDAVLVATGKSLAAAVRRDDLVARLGGDEFGILLSDVGDEQIGIVLDRLRASVAKGGDVTASVGYVAGRAGAERGPLLAAAERAMRAAKRAGGNQVIAAESPS